MAEEKEVETTGHQWDTEEGFPLQELCHSLLGALSGLANSRRIYQRDFGLVHAPRTSHRDGGGKRGQKGL